MTRTGFGYRSGPVVATLIILYSIELIALLCSGMVVASLGRAHLGRGPGLLALSLVAAAAVVGWHAIRLLQGRYTLSVAGLAIQSAILIAAIALATQRPTIGVAGVIVASGVLAGWGRLGRPPRSAEPLAVSLQTALTSDGRGVAGEAGKVGISGVVLVLLTSALVLAALSVRGGIVVGPVILAVIFIPLERLFALRPR